MTSERLRLAITAGDPAGIGPEIVVDALASGSLAEFGPIDVHAEASLFTLACERCAIDPSRLPGEARLVPVEAGPVPADFQAGQPSAFTGRVAYEAVKAAANAALKGELAAMVTAPISKAALRASGVEYPGHTELLADLAGVTSVAMMFVCAELRLTLATIHVALAEVPRVLTRDAVWKAIDLTRACLVEREKIAEPRIAVLGLNPHAGEEGLFGDEEERIIEPALDEARGRGWAVEGPFPADSFFSRRRRLQGFDGVIAMYHDQGLIPVKLLSGGRAVNVTLGLPFLRTSVDHGTAFDIAGRSLASSDSLVEAVRLARHWTRVRRVRASS